MANDVTVSPEGLRQAPAEANDQVQTTLSGILSTLQGKTAARGKPWGDDSYGSQFYDGSSGYGQVSAATMTNGQSLSETFGQTGESIVSASAGFDEAETTSSSSFNG